MYNEEYRKHFEEKAVKTSSCHRAELIFIIALAKTWNVNNSKTVLRNYKASNCLSKSPKSEISLHFIVEN